MGCCTSKPCMPKWCGNCCKKRNTTRNIDEPASGPAGEGNVTIQMNELAEENEDEDCINDEVTVGVLLPEQSVSLSKQPSPRGNHNSNYNNDAHSERPDRKPSSNNKSKAPTNGSLHATPPLYGESTSSQYQFFKLLDEKIELGPDYDANCERERKFECERLNTLMRNWETCSRNSSQASTPQKRSNMSRPTAQPLPAIIQTNISLEQATQSPHQFRHQQIIMTGHTDLPRMAPHQLNRVEPAQLLQVKSQQHSATVAGIQAGRYWPPMEMGFSNFQEIYDYENPIQHQQVGPAINHTATIIHQTYEVIGSHTPIPALLRTGVGTTSSPVMNRQLFQFGPRNCVGGFIAGASSAREYHQEMYTGSHNATPSRQQMAIFDQNGVPPKARCVLVPTPQPQRLVNPSKKYDTYTYRQASSPNVNVISPLPPISTSAQLKFSTLVSQGTPLQQQSAIHGNGEMKLGKKLVLSKESQLNRPSKEQLKHQQLVYGEMHQQQNQKGNSSVPQQIQENQQHWQLQSNGPVPIPVPTGSGLAPGQSGSANSNTRSFQSTVHIPMKTVVPELRKPQNNVQQEHAERKKLN